MNVRDKIKNLVAEKENVDLDHVKVGIERKKVYDPINNRWDSGCYAKLEREGRADVWLGFAPSYNKLYDYLIYYYNSYYTPE